MIYRLALILLLLATPAYALKMGPMMASSTTYAPSAPVSVSGAAGNGQVTVTWSAGTVDGTHSAATSYNLYRSTSSGAETLWQSGVTSPYVDTASNGTGYYYKVQAVNSAGNALSTEAGPYTPTATVYAPNAPVMTASAGNAQITYTWSAPAVDGTHSAATSYNLRYGTVSGTLGTTVTGVTSPYTLTGRTNGTTYYAKLDAINSAGTTSQVSEVSAMPAASTYIAQANFASSSVDTGFTGKTSGTGSVTSNNPTGYATLTATAASDAAMVTYDTALPSNKIFKVRVKGKYNASADASTTAKFIGVVDRATAEVAGDTGTNFVFDCSAYPINNQIMWQYNTGASTGFWWTPSGQTAGAWGSTVWQSSIVTSGTEYVFELESNGTQARFTLYNSDGTTIKNQTAWVAWSSVRTISNNLWLYVGDRGSDGKPTMVIDYITIQ